MNSHVKYPVGAMVGGVAVIIFTNSVAEAARVHDGAEVIMAPHAPDTVESALASAIREPVVSAITTTGNMSAMGVSASGGFFHLTSAPRLT
jgi:hypothetical protein